MLWQPIQERDGSIPCVQYDLSENYGFQCRDTLNVIWSYAYLRGQMVIIQVALEFQNGCFGA